MRRIPLSQITPGMVVSQDLFNDRGELLLAKGVLISPRHIATLKKRNIFELVAYERIDSRPETKSRLESVGSPSRIDGPSPARPVPSISAEFMQLRIRTLKQLLAGPTIRELELHLKENLVTGRPVGAGLRTSLASNTPKRSIADIVHVRNTYEECLDSLTNLLDSLVAGEILGISPFRSLAESLVKLFECDRNILLAVVGQDPETDDYVYRHAVDVAVYAIAIAVASGYNREQVLTCALGGLLHDVGMLLVPDEIRRKQGALNPDEFREIEKHPVLGVLVLSRIRHLREPLAFMAFQSHEREDGSGYPRRRTGSGIHQMSKIIQTADVYDALTSERSYKERYSPFSAVEKLIRMGKDNRLSMITVRCLLRYLSLFPVGSVVELSDGVLAKTIDANGDAFDKPVVAPIRDKNGGLCAPDHPRIDLLLKPNLLIVQAFAQAELSEISLADGFLSR